MARHLMLLDEAFVAAVTGGAKRIIVEMPPRHGKSEFFSRWVPSWYLGQFPNKRIILSSYEAKFAATWGRRARDTMEEFGSHVFGVKVSQGSSAANQWEIAGYEGGMQTAGAGGALTGKGCDLLIVDDAIKNSEEAFSQTIRDGVWDWWCSTAYTRLEPDGIAAVIHTRWHEDDLIGRLRKDMEAGGEQWNIISFPAINERNEALWPERFSLERLREIEHQVGGYFWNALYQQRPTAKEGSFFKIGNVRIVDAVPAGLRYVRAWDLAATEDDGDYTAGVKIGTDGKGSFFVVDVERGQWATDERDRRLRSAAENDGKECKQRLPEDPGQAGKSQALSMTRLLAGFSVKTVRVSGDKQTRADPFSSQFNAGNVFLLSDAGQEKKWVKAFIEELRTFPRGKHDDQVDAASDAFDELAQRRKFVFGGMPTDD
jgi:predicted phage terminase large subunit-like protein